MERKKVDVNTYMKKHKGQVSFFLFITLCVGFIAPLQSFILQWIIDAASKAEVVHYLLLGIGIIIGTFVLESVCRNVFSKIQCRTIEFLRNSCMQSLLKRNMKKYNNASNSAELSLLTNDMKLLNEDYFSAIFEIVFYGSMLFWALCMYIYIDPLLLIFVCIAAIAPLVLPRLLDKKLKNSRADFSEKSAGYVQDISEIMNGYEVIYNFGAEKKFKEKNHKATEECAHSEYVFLRTMNYSITLASLLSNILFFLVLLLGMFLVFEDKITLGYMLAATNLSNFVIAPCRVISQNYARLKASEKIRQKIENMINVQETKADSKEKVLTTAVQAVRADHVSFSYEGNQEQILSDICFECRGKEKIAFVGQSGCGKSTLAKLLYRYLEEYSGSISFNGIDLKRIAPHELYQSVGYVSQNAYIFHDTIRNNICLYEPYSEEELKRALEAVGLEAYISTLKDGVDTVLSENVKNLSGGQLQRIALARLIIRKYDMIIADEVTSSLDPENTADIMNYLLNLDCMVLIITHDVYGSYMKKFNAVYEINEGKLVSHTSATHFSRSSQEMT